MKIPCEDVKVKKGFAIGDEIQSGFVQTIDVVLKESKAQSSAKEEWKEICESLSKKLFQNSSGLTPIRVMTEDDYKKLTTSAREFN